MLKKVMKHEFKSLGRIILPVLALGFGLVGVAWLIRMLAKFLPDTGENIVGSVLKSISFIALFALIMGAVVIVVYRFYMSMAGQEAYLTFSLPAKAQTHIIGKLMVGLLFVMAAIATASLAGRLFGLLEGMDPAVMRLNLPSGSMSQQLNFSTLPFALKASFFGSILLIIISSFAVVLSTTYSAISLGTQTSKNRLLTSVLAYFIIDTVQQFISLAVLLASVFIFGKMNALDNISKNSLMEMATSSQAEATIIKFAIILFLAIFVLQAILVVAQFFITKHFFTKKLNVQ